MHAKKIIAHRGAHEDCKENTLQAFENAIAIGADMVEFDVRKCRDNMLVVHHDETLQGRMIRSMDYATIHAIDKDIPTLEHVLESLQGRIHLDVELKEIGYEDEVAEMVLDFFDTEEIIFSSFNDITLAEIKRIRHNTKVGLILGKQKPDHPVFTRLSEFFPMKRIINAHADYLFPHFKVLKFGFLDRAQKHRIPVYVWTLNDEALMKKYINDDRVAGIVTDVPGKAIKLISSP